jgi:type II protein arginine methyltransferase
MAPADVHVLDIGTGTGLLAMMAARAGAGRVTACESVGPLAEIARDIVARNGFADRITVIHKRSVELAIGDDLPGPADLLVAEIVDAGLLNEAILATIADARARLLKPGAAIIPHSAVIYAMPIESADIAAERRVDEAAGFDISPFNALRPRLYLQTDLAKYDWRPLAAPAELFRFDFTRDGPAGAETSVRLLPNSDGVAHAIAFWFRLALDDETALATGPTDPPTHWKQAVFGIEEPIAVKQGEPVRLHARHDGRRIAIALQTRVDMPR